MALRPRIYYNAEQKAQMWDRWQKGESLTGIGRVFDRPSSSVFNQLSPSGGIRPPPRRRSRISLTLSEREEISRGIVCDLSVRAIASQLGRSPSTVSREINRNGGHRDLKSDSRANIKWPDWPTWQTVLARCYAQGLQTDAAVGQLLDVVGELGLADDTLVIVTADHGDTIASHGGVWDKHSTFPEEVASIPLVVKWPGHVKAGKRIDELVTSMDVTGTMLCAAGASIDDIDGRNLVPLCRSDRTITWPDHLICEHYGHSGDVLHQRIAYKNQWKYVAVYGGDDELYNLTDDPYELSNLVSDGEYSSICSELRKLLIEELRHERDTRAENFPPSELEYMLVDSTPLWPREEKMLLYKLEHMEAD
jgi:hypothetical protein